MSANLPTQEPDLWSIPVGASLCLLATALVYLRGYLKIRQTRPALFQVWRFCCFWGGLFSLWMALASPLDTLNDVSLFMHMSQHMVLMLVVPPLLLLGNPAVPMLRGLPRFFVRRGLGPIFRSRRLRNAMHFLTSIPFAWILMNAVFIGWHLPRPYELALGDSAWHDLEHASFLVASLFFWFPVIQPWPSTRRGSGWWLLPYLVTADIVNTVLAATLTFSTHLIYPSYGISSTRYAISPLKDQAAAGALMWVIGSMFYLVPLVSITMRLLSPSERQLVLVSK